MLASQRTSLIHRGLALMAAFDPATITVAGHDIPARRRRSAAATAAADVGGFSVSVPLVFMVLRSDIPAVVEFVPQSTAFQHDGKEWLVQDATDQPGEPHLRISANLHSR